MNRKNADYIKDNVKDDIVLPEALSGENIENLLKQNTPVRSKKGEIRKFAAVGVAACVMITSLFILKDRGVFTPENIPGTIPEGTSDKVQLSASEKFDDYSSLLAFIRAYADEAKDDFLYSYNGVVGSDEAVDMEADMSGATSAPTTQGGTGVKGEYGETNTREEGVKEEDIFITDGEYLYFVDGYSDIRIVKAEADGTLTEISSIKTGTDYSEDQGKYLHYTGLYRYKDLLIAGFSCQFVEDHIKSVQTSGAYIFDISDVTSPKKIKEISFDGNYFSSRIIGSKFVLVCNYPIRNYYYDATDDRLIPGFYNETVRTTVPVENITCIEQESPESYINIAIADLDAPEKDAKVSSFLGYASEMYCTETTLYSLKTEYGYYIKEETANDFVIIPEENKTKITSIDISGDTAVFKASSKVEGTVLNSFSVDEYDGYLRLALTKNEDNCIIVLNDKLEKTGELTGIAPGERIQSARFMGNTAYVVTFVQTDPLFVIDMSDPAAPKILGEVKLPGFSAYLHPAGEGYLVGIGYGGTEDGLDGSAKISLFDVRDPANPKETDYLVFEETQLVTEYKAYCAVDENSFLVPFIKWYKYTETEKYFGLLTGALYVSAENGKLTLENSYTVRSLEGALRATFIENYVYLYGMAPGVASFNMESGEFIANAGAIKEDYFFTAADEKQLNSLSYEYKNS